MASSFQSEPARATGLGGILRQFCPRCGRGKIFGTSIFRLFPKLNERCPVCGLKFEREEGYFLGAMVVSYILAILMIPLLAAFIWVITRWCLNWVMVASIVLFIPAAPALSSFSRVLYIYFDQAIDPDES